MRFEIINTITSQSWVRAVPPPQNPIRIGRDERNDVVLPSTFVYPEAAAISRELREEHWQLWNLAGREIRLDQTSLTEKNSHVPIRSGQTIVLYPFNIRVAFDPEEMQSDADNFRNLDAQCAEVVHDVHRKLLELFSNQAKQTTDQYILDLEKRIEELAITRRDFPTDDMSQTPIGNHMAGVAVRSELMRELIASSGDALLSLNHDKDLTGWDRLRTLLPEMEQNLQKCTTWVSDQLKMKDQPDLTAKMKKLSESFWPLWAKMLRPPNTIATRTTRYFALRRLKEEIKDLWFGFGPLEDLLEDPIITEIMVVDREHIFVEKDGMIENSGRRFRDEAQTLSIIQKIVNGAERDISTSSPLADARMPDGSRVNAVINNVALKGSCLTIRRFPKKRKTIDELIARHQTLTKAARDFLEAAVINRRNIIVSGGTGTGKTTLLNCLSAFIPDKERIVTIEDTAELQLQKEHVITLQVRQKNTEGRGEVTIRDLVKNSLRMRPDRIVVGECRSGEAIDMLQAMNTGHDGSMTTLHANSPHGVIQRLEVLVQQNADTRLPVESIHRQIVSAVDLIVQLTTVNLETKVGNEIRREKRRIVSEIAEITDLEPDGGVRIVPLFARREGGLGELLPTGYLPTFLPALIESGLIENPEELVVGIL